MSDSGPEPAPRGYPRARLTRHGESAERHAARVWSRRIRLRHWAHFLVLPLASLDPHAPVLDALFPAVRGVASAFCVLAFGYLLNSISDRRMDLDERKNPFIVPGAGEYRYSLAGLATVALILALLGPWPVQLATVLCLGFGYVYSMGPRIKSIPFLGTVANVGNFGPLLFLGMRDAALPPRFEYVALAFGALLLQNQLIHESADAVEDRAGHVRTTWLTLGPFWTAFIAAVSGFGAATAAMYLVPSELSAVAIVTVGAVFGAAFPSLLARGGGKPSQTARLRVAHRCCALLVGAGLFTLWRWAA